MTLGVSSSPSQMSGVPVAAQRRVNRFMGHLGVSVRGTQERTLTLTLLNRQPASNDALVGRQRPLIEGRREDVAAFLMTPEGQKFEREYLELHSSEIARDNTRGIRDMQLKPGVGGELDAVLQFGKAESMAIVVGFKVPVPNGEQDGKPQYKGVQETDGPLGAAFMVLACLKNRKPVSVICDRETEALVKACLRKLVGEDTVAAVRFLPFEAQEEHAAGKAADVIAAKLSRAKTDTVVLIELAGRNAEGVSLNMGGIDITHMNPNYDALVETIAPGRHVIAIGDGGNEAGFGGAIVPGGVPKAPNGRDIQARTGANSVVRSSVSNSGGIFLSGGAMRLCGNTSAEMPTTGEHNNAIAAMLALGAVDGCTKDSREGVTANGVVNGKAVPWTTGVDGISIAENGRVYAQVREFAAVASVGFEPGRLPGWDVKRTIVHYDSSSGVIPAGRQVSIYLDYQLPGEHTHVFAGDHGNAPYGSQTPEAIREHASRFLAMVRRHFGDRPVVIECNTVCSALFAEEEAGKIVSISTWSGTPRP